MLSRHPRGWVGCVCAPVIVQGGFKAAKPAAGAPKLADEQIQAYHLDQLAKLEKNFKAKKAALTTLKT